MEGTSEVKDGSFKEIIPGYQDVNSYSQVVLQTVVGAIKASNELPPHGDTYDYYSSFKGFRQFLNKEGKNILGLMSSLMKTQGGRKNLKGLDLEEKFDLLVDVNDTISEKIGNALDEASDKKKDELVIVNIKKDSKITTSWNRKTFAKKQFHLLAARNIQRPQLKFSDKIDNSNTCFVPIIKYKPNSIKPLAVLLEKVGDEETYSHPYEVEIDKFEPSEEQLDAVEPQMPKSLEETPFLFVKTVKEFKTLCKEIKSEKEFAVDLEHHSYRTFQGITCLMQISTRVKDYLIDTLELRSEMHHLNEIFTNPKICKVFHGADLDIQWLQRDFGVYVVNLFDTGQAARVLNFHSFSLAFLLKHYCNVDANKQYQLADWRIRPLPQEMIQYAREDTHYLLYIYDRLKMGLIEKGNMQKNYLQLVFNHSKQICSKKYEKLLFNENSYLTVYKKCKKHLNNQQLYAFKKLYEWRDKIARQEDESIGYVLPNNMLIQIASALPREQQGLMACCNPTPPLVRQNLIELHKLILEALEISVTKPEIKLNTAIPPPENTIDLDNILNCPHDIGQEPEINLPTVLGDPTEISIPNAVNGQIKYSVQEPSTTIFAKSTKLPKQNFKDNNSHVKNFASPYCRDYLNKKYRKKNWKKRKPGRPHMVDRSVQAVMETPQEKRTVATGCKPMKRGNTLELYFSKKPWKNHNCLTEEETRLISNILRKRTAPADVDRKYTLVKPFQLKGTSALPKRSTNATDNGKRINNLYQHLRDLMSGTENVTTPSITETAENKSVSNLTNVENPSVSSSSRTVNTDEINIDDENDATINSTETSIQNENQSDSDIEIVLEKKPSKRRKRKKKPKFQAEVFLKVGSEESSQNQTKPFKPYDYSQVDDNFYKRKKSKKTKEFNPDSTVSSDLGSKPRKRKRKKDRSIASRSASQKKSQHWPKK